MEPVPGYFRTLKVGSDDSDAVARPTRLGWLGRPGLIDQFCHVFVSGVLNQHEHVYEYTGNGVFVGEFTVVDGSLGRASATASGLIGLGIGRTRSSN